MLKREHGRLEALVRQGSCAGVWPEGEEWIREALVGVIGCRHFLVSRTINRFIVTLLLLLDDCAMYLAGAGSRIR